LVGPSQLPEKTCTAILHTEFLSYNPHSVSAGTPHRTYNDPGKIAITHVLFGGDADYPDPNGFVYSKEEIAQSIRRLTRLKAARQAESANWNPPVRRAA
jgi:hypothetical protein